MLYDFIFYLVSFGRAINSGIKWIIMTKTLLFTVIYEILQHFKGVLANLVYTKITEIF